MVVSNVICILLYCIRLCIMLYLFLLLILFLFSQMFCDSLWINTVNINIIDEVK